MTGRIPGVLDLNLSGMGDDRKDSSGAESVGYRGRLEGFQGFWAESVGYRRPGEHEEKKEKNEGKEEEISAIHGLGEFDSP